jgi:hypothetical protein
MKKIFNILIVIIGFILLVGINGYLKFNPLQKPVQPVATDLVTVAKNATYDIDGTPVTLVNGTAQVASAPGSASVTTTTYFGNEAKGDFNGDGKDDLVFLVTQDGGGSGTFYYVATLLSSPTGYTGTNAILLGDRISPQTTEVQSGEIVVNYADRKPSESMATPPSIGVSRYFKIADGVLTEVHL